MLVGSCVFAVLTQLKTIYQTMTKEKNNMKKNAKIAIGLGVGVLVGAGLAVLAYKVKKEWDAMEEDWDEDDENFEMFDEDIAKEYDKTNYVTLNNCERDLHLVPGVYACFKENKDEEGFVTLEVKLVEKKEDSTYNLTFAKPIATEGDFEKITEGVVLNIAMKENNHFYEVLSVTDEDTTFSVCVKEME
jgi:hypothetical protein